MQGISKNIYLAVSVGIILTSSFVFGCVSVSPLRTNQNHDLVTPHANSAGSHLRVSVEP
jgi:hypothetical protein